MSNSNSVTKNSALVTEEEEEASLSLSLSLSLSHTHTHTHNVHLMYISMYRIWISIILGAFLRMSMIRILTYEYGTNGKYG